MCVLLGSMVSKMSGKQQSSERTRDSDVGHVGSELNDLALSLASSKEVYGGLCSPLADHAVCTLIMIEMATNLSSKALYYGDNYIINNL